MGHNWQCQIPMDTCIYIVALGKILAEYHSLEGSLFFI